MFSEATVWDETSKGGREEGMRGRRRMNGGGGGYSVSLMKKKTSTATISGAPSYLQAGWRRPTPLHNMRCI